MDKENAFTLFKLLGYFLAAAAQLCFFCFYATQITHLVSRVHKSTEVSLLFYGLPKNFLIEIYTAGYRFLIAITSILICYAISGIANSPFGVFLRMGDYNFRRDERIKY